MQVLSFVILIWLSVSVLTDWQHEMEENGLLYEVIREAYIPKYECGYIAADLTAFTNGSIFRNQCSSILAYMKRRIDDADVFGKEFNEQLEKECDSSVDMFVKQVDTLLQTYMKEYPSFIFEHNNLGRRSKRFIPLAIAGAGVVAVGTAGTYFGWQLNNWIGSTENENIKEIHNFLKKQNGELRKTMMVLNNRHYRTTFSNVVSTFSVELKNMFYNILDDMTVKGYLNSLIVMNGNENGLVNELYNMIGDDWFDSILGSDKVLNSQLFTSKVIGFNSVDSHVLLEIMCYPTVPRSRSMKLINVISMSNMDTDMELCSYKNIHPYYVVPQQCKTLDCLKPVDYLNGKQIEDFSLVNEIFVPDDCRPSETSGCMTSYLYATGVTYLFKRRMYLSTFVVSNAKFGKWKCADVVDHEWVVPSMFMISMPLSCSLEIDGIVISSNIQHGVMNMNVTSLRERHSLTEGFIVFVAFCGVEMRSYMFYFPLINKSWCIDATSESAYKGKLINHSIEDANLKTKALLVDGIPKLVFFASKDIEIGHELLYDYGERNQNITKDFPWLLR